MKKSILLLGALMLFSCQQDDLSEFTSEEVNQVQTRTESPISDFNPIKELADKPIHIMNVGNKRNKYLSAEKSGRNLLLKNGDDGSGRQRWRVKTEGLLYGQAFVLEGGNSGITSNHEAVLFPDPYKEIPDSPIEPNFEKPTTVKLRFMYSYDVPPRIGCAPLADGTCLISSLYGQYYPLTSTYLSTKSDTSSAIIFSDNNSTDLSKWQLSLIGEYELVDLEYVRTTVDNIAPTEVVCAYDEYTNETSSTNTWHYSVTASYTETSSFSKTEGVSVAVSQGINVGLPNLLGGESSVGFNASIQQQTNRSWTFGNSDAKTVTQVRTGDIPVQPGETVRLNVSSIIYKGSMTYVATLRKIGDSKTFRVKGKWTGDCFSIFKAKAYNPATGKVLREFSLD